MADSVQQSAATVETTQHAGDADADLGSRMAKVLGDLSGGAKIDKLGTIEESNDVEAPAADEKPAAEARDKSGRFLPKHKTPSHAANPSTPAEEAADPDAERKERLERVREMEKQHFSRANKVTERERAAEAREKAIAERESRVQSLEGAFADPDGLLSLLEEKVGAEKLSHWILQQADPAKKAEHAAKRVKTDIEKQIDDLRKKAEEERAQLAAERRTLAERQEFEKAAGQLHSRVREVADDAPLVARLWDKRPQRAAAMADQIAREFQAQGVAWNFDDVILTMRERLDDEASIYSPTQDSGGEQQQSTRAATPSARATAKQTVSNRQAADRSSIVKPEDLADLPLDERARRLERRLRGSRR